MNKIGKIKPAKLANLALFIAPLVLLTYYFADHPYKSELARRSVSLNQYSREQRLNFITAARAIDGAVIEPGQTFSFNQKVGPRTGSRGFVPAGSYVGGSRVASEGGGICLISSNLYQTALLSGLAVKERTAHTTCVRSVPPGLDATVWYGKADLKLVNPYNEPVQIRCSNQENPEELVLAIMGPDNLKAAAARRALRRRELGFDGRNLLVEVYVDNAGAQAQEKSELVSRDSYRLP
jgi:vancomycin resistance protein VanW